MSCRGNEFELHNVELHHPSEIVPSRDNTISKSETSSINKRPQFSDSTQLLPQDHERVSDEARTFQFVHSKHPNPTKTFIPSFGLTALRDKFRSRSKEECPKEVCNDSRRSAFYCLAFLHLPAISITLMLMSLYVRRFRWTPPHPTADELSALQFAAKIHESFILISLGDVLLHRIQYGLLIKDGIPLGFLSSVYNLVSPVLYLMSWEFWAALLNPTPNRKFHGVTGAIIIILSLLSIGASPFSAITMIPRQGWWLVGNGPGGEKISDITPDYYISGDLYKMELTSEDVFKSANIYCQPGISEATCMKPGLETIVLELLPTYIDPPIMPRKENISYNVNDATRKNRPISITTAGQYQEVSFATCPMTFVADALGNEFAYVEWTGYDDLLIKSERERSSIREKWKQPLVAVHCNSTWMEGDTANFDFNGGFLENTTLSLDLKDEFKSLNSTEDNKTQVSLLNPTILDTEHEKLPPLSAAIIFGGRVNLSSTTGDSNTTFGVNLALCLVSARWVEADAWVQRSSSIDVKSDIGFPTADTFTYLQKTATANSIIKMSEGWLNGVGTIDSGTNTTADIPLYQAATQFCLPTGSVILPGCFSTLLSAHFTDSLSGPTRLRFPGFGSKDEPPGQNDTLIKHTYYTNSYAYVFQNSIALPLAFATLLLHLAVALIHCGIVILSPVPWHGSSWGSFGQILVLALQSRAPQGLENTSAGVASSQTWKKVTVVREVGNEGRLEMVLEPGQEDRKDFEAMEYCAGDPRLQTRRVQSRMKYN